jgi:transposase
MVVTSDGEKVDNPSGTDKSSQTAGYPRTVSRRKKRRDESAQAVRLLQCQHARISESTQRLLNKLANRLVSVNDVLAIEDCRSRTWCAIDTCPRASWMQAGDSSVNDWTPKR